MHGLLVCSGGSLELLIKPKSVFERVVPFSNFAVFPLIIEKFIFYSFQNTEIMLLHDYYEKVNLFESYLNNPWKLFGMWSCIQPLTSNHLLRFLKNEM